MKEINIDNMVNKQVRYQMAPRGGGGKGEGEEEERRELTKFTWKLPVFDF